MQTDTHQKFNWTGRMETLEDRLVMSADPLGGLLGGSVEHHAILDAPPALDHHLQSAPDFWIDDADQGALEEHLRQIDQSLASAHDQTGLDQVRNDYGFTGIGQTVAVIDSGIAYDHYALGGGFGSNYRVVGGWDFTDENDANPYDDGPSGSHGTHVSGIIGSSDSTHEGVAPGVDLVGLRVFDDVGSGYFSWVENALDWVHANRNSFENPITTVNLSLGVASWNADTIPNWANLEDEFAQLEADGIFISVSAGNSYSSFNTAGLSYPAASSHVVPVMSTDDSGLLSYFSQRHSQAIAAPGRWVTSTVPDYKGDNDGTTDDFATYSGTSMAAPYVAGASVIIREAMEFSGYTNITQDTIYDHMIATADSFYDSATNAWYDRLNLEAAIDALMPVDDFGSTEAAAYNLGMIGDTMSMSGAITTLGDMDYFSFTAENTGTVSFTASNMTHELDALWHVSGGTGTWSGDNNEILTVDVAAGQTYAVCLSTDNGLGYYDIDIIAESNFSFTDWGAVAFNQLDAISVAGESWYRVEATSAGYLTAEGLFNGAGGQVSLELYNSNLQLIDTGNAVNGTSRVDTYANAGDEFFLKVLGTNSDVDFRLTNLVSLVGTTVNVTGTAGDDAFEFTAGNTHQISVNGTTYSFASIAISDIHFNGGAGNDSIVLTGTAGNETALLRVGNTTLGGTGFTIDALAIEAVSVYGNGGHDAAVFYDSIGNDTLTSDFDTTILSGTNYISTVVNFDNVKAYSTVGGNDTAVLNDSASDDVFYATPLYTVAKSSGFYIRASGFNTVTSQATNGGFDRIKFYDSINDDAFSAAGNQAQFTGNGFDNTANGFENVDVFATAGGTDIATLNDTVGNDSYYTWPTYAVMFGTGYNNRVRGFESVNAYSAAGGTDIVNMHDSQGDDVFTANSLNASFIGTGFSYFTQGFDEVYAIANVGGTDQAVLSDSAGDDRFNGTAAYSVMYGTGYYNSVGGFETVRAISSLGGNDIAYLYDTLGDDVFENTLTFSRLSGNNYANEATGFSNVRVLMSQGYDTANFRDLDNGHTYYGRGDLATIHDWANDVRGYGFDEVTTYSAAGQTPSVNISALDYIFNQVGS